MTWRMEETKCSICGEVYMFQKEERDGTQTYKCKNGHRMMVSRQHSEQEQMRDFFGIWVKDQ
jgi:hypothetical protein